MAEEKRLGYPTVRCTWNKIVIFWKYTNDTLRNGKRTPVVELYSVYVEHNRFPDLIIMLPKIELNILFIHTITYVLIYHTILSILYRIPCLIEREGWLCYLMQLSVQNCIHMYSWQFTSCQMLCVKFEYNNKKKKSNKHNSKTRCIHICKYHILWKHAKNRWLRCNVMIYKNKSCVNHVPVRSTVPRSEATGKCVGGNVWRV